MRAQVVIGVLLCALVLSFVELGEASSKLKHHKKRLGAATRMPVARSVPINSKGPESLEKLLSLAFENAASYDAVLLYWNPEDVKECSSVRAMAAGEPIGHIALAFKNPSNPTEFYYVSWWPHSTGHGGGAFNFGDLNTDADNHTPTEDIQAEKVYPALLHGFKKLNLARMESRMQTELTTGKYVFASSNCGHVATRVLKEGMGTTQAFDPKVNFLVLQPSDVFRALSTAGESIGTLSIFSVFQPVLPEPITFKGLRHRKCKD